MIAMPDIEFARTLYIAMSHIASNPSIFLWCGQNAIEVDRNIFIDEVCREFDLVPSAIPEQLLAA